MDVIEAANELVLVSGQYTSTLKRGSSGNLYSRLLRVYYLHTVRLCHMQQPHQRLLAIVVITSVPPGRYESDSVGLQETFAQHLISMRRDRYRLEKYVYVPNMHEFASEDSARLS